MDTIFRISREKSISLKTWRPSISFHLSLSLSLSNEFDDGNLAVILYGVVRSVRTTNKQTLLYPSANDSFQWIMTTSSLMQHTNKLRHTIEMTRRYNRKTTSSEQNNSKNIKACKSHYVAGIAAVLYKQLPA